jgi:hypothetical protein
MRRLLTCLALWGFAVVAGAQEKAPAPAPCLHTETRFHITVPAPYEEASLIFGPEGERVWAGEEWDPYFLYPLPARDEEGAVFTLHHGPMQVTWINTAFDLPGRHIQYVYFLPGVMVTLIDLRFQPAGASTGVDVRYARTALSPDGNEHVQEFTRHDQKSGRHWQEGIDAWLAGRKTERHP